MHPQSAKVKNGRSTCLSLVVVDTPFCLSMARKTSSPFVGRGASPGFCFKKASLFFSRNFWLTSRTTCTLHWGCCEKIWIRCIWPIFWFLGNHWRSFSQFWTCSTLRFHLVFKAGLLLTEPSTSVTLSCLYAAQMMVHSTDFIDDWKTARDWTWPSMEQW